jgi:Xaa-Pro aminopeptidase
MGKHRHLIFVEFINLPIKMQKYRFLLLLLLPFTGFSQMPKILDLRTQGEVRDQWLAERMETVLPDLMRREGIDMWLIIAREYNEDPVLRTMLPSTWLAARRTTMLVIYDNGQELETLACARYDVGDVFKKAWDPEVQPNQWERLVEIIKERNPRKIGLNRSPSFGHADGLTAHLYDQLLKYLPAEYHGQLTSAEGLAVGWLETRTDSELVVYQQIVRIAHQIIREGFSDQVIQPGVTTTDDVVWFYRERIRSLGLQTWFHPTVDIQRQDPESFDHLRTFSKRPEKQVIQPGDLLHVDFGITYLGLNSDTQENAYVLHPHETQAPDFLVKAHQKGLRLMDILTDEFEEGVTGNEALLAARQKAISEGIKPSIYTHPIGYHGHGAGPAIGMWDKQEGVPFTGDYPIRYNTAYSIELNAGVYIDEWKKEIRMMMEEDAVFTKDGVRYIDGRQTELFLIPEQLPKNGQGF